MATVVADMSMSLDGFIADSSNGVAHLFGWYGKGPETVTMPGDARTFKMSAASARQFREAVTNVGALITGRRLFDMTRGWGGNHPAGAPVFVVTHSVPDDWPREDAPFTFVLEGIESAVEQAKAVAGEKVVAVASANVAQQCLDARLLDAIRVNLVPVLLGEGVPFFENLKGTPVELEDPTVTESTGVTHLYYRVR